jgi:hypothetical protein
MCYVKNDRAGLPFNGTVTLETLSFADGRMASVHIEHVTLAAGAGTSHYFNAGPNLANISGVHNLLIATVQDVQGDGASGTTNLATNEIALVAPKDMRLPPAKVTVHLGGAGGETTPHNPDGTYNILLQTNATALYVTVTARAHGRFSDNFFAMRAGEKRTIKFVPFAMFDQTMLAETLRVEHMQMYI